MYYKRALYAYDRFTVSSWFLMFYWADSGFSLSVHFALSFLVFFLLFFLLPCLLSWLFFVFISQQLSVSCQNNAARFRLLYVSMCCCIWHAGIPAATCSMFSPPHSAYSGHCSRACGELVSTCACESGHLRHTPYHNKDGSAGNKTEVILKWGVCVSVS